MSAVLTFALAEHLDAHATDAILFELRRQLAGVQLSRNDLGTWYQIRLPVAGESTLRSIQVRLSEMSVPYLANVDPATDFALTFPASTLDEAVELPADLTAYVAHVTVARPDDVALLNRSLARYDELVGVPKEAIVEDLEARLRGVDWLAAWSSKHHGEVLPGIQDTARASSFVLLVGDPGTGKTILAQQLPAVLAVRMLEPVLFVQLSQRLRGDGLQGRAGSDVVRAMEAIGQLAERERIPVIAFLDDGEAVTGRRSIQDGSSGANENIAVVDALINGLDRVFARPGARVVFIMATNLLDRVDPAVIRRATKYQFERPTSKLREQILRRALGNALSNEDLRFVNSALDNASPRLTAADILTQVVTQAIREAALRDEPLTMHRLLDLAMKAVPTPET